MLIHHNYPFNRPAFPIPTLGYPLLSWTWLVFIVTINLFLLCFRWFLSSAQCPYPSPLRCFQFLLFHRVCSGMASVRCCFQFSSLNLNAMGIPPNHRLPRSPSLASPTPFSPLPHIRLSAPPAPHFYALLLRPRSGFRLKLPVPAAAAADSDGLGFISAPPPFFFWVLSWLILFVGWFGREETVEKWKKVKWCYGSKYICLCWPWDAWFQEIYITENSELLSFSDFSLSITQHCFHSRFT